MFWLSQQKPGWAQHIALANFMFVCFSTHWLMYSEQTLTRREKRIWSLLSLVNSSLVVVTIESCPQFLPCLTPAQHLLLIEPQRCSSPELTAFQFCRQHFCLRIYACAFLSTSCCRLLTFCASLSHLIWSVSCSCISKETLQLKQLVSIYFNSHFITEAFFN